MSFTQCRIPSSSPCRHFEYQEDPGDMWRRRCSNCFLIQSNSLFLSNSNLYFGARSSKLSKSFVGPKSILKIPFVSVGGAVLWKLAQRFS